MRVQVALKTLNDSLIYQTFDGVQAHINPRGILQIMRGLSIVAEFPSGSYVGWQYVLSPFQPTADSRAANLLSQHHGT